MRPDVDIAFASHNVAMEIRRPLGVAACRLLVECQEGLNIALSSRAYTPLRAGHIPIFADPCDVAALPHLEPVP
jgi:hypothetical protein